MKSVEVFLALVPAFKRQYSVRVDADGDVDSTVAKQFAHDWLNLQVGQIATIVVVHFDKGGPMPVRYETRWVKSLDVDGLKYECVGLPSSDPHKAKPSALNRCPKCGGSSKGECPLCAGFL